jgi:predicted ribonuclease YlaK
MKQEAAKINEKSSKINLIQDKTQELQSMISAKPMKEQEVILIMAMIEERNRLKRESKELKAECKEKKKNLDQELERVKKHNEELAKKEHAEILTKIDEKYDGEYKKLLERRKKIAA